MKLIISFNSSSSLLLDMHGQGCFTPRLENKSCTCFKKEVCRDLRLVSISGITRTMRFVWTVQLCYISCPSIPLKMNAPQTMHVDHNEGPHLKPHSTRTRPHEYVNKYVARYLIYIVLNFKIEPIFP